MVFSGSLIVRGVGHCRGDRDRRRAARSARSAQSLAQLETEAPRLQRQMRRLVCVFAAVGGGGQRCWSCVLYGLLRGGWLEARAGRHRVGMSMLPEEFPMVLAVFMAMGAWRISQARVLTRRAAAIETLGAATVLCTDKTGTLTENRMTIAELRLPRRRRRPRSAARPCPRRFETLRRRGCMASAPEPFDPMEKAFHALAQADMRTARRLPGTGWKLVRTYPLAPDLLAMSQVWDTRRRGAGGSPPRARRRRWPSCAGSMPQRARQLTAQVDQMASAGLARAGRGRGGACRRRSARQPARLRLSLSGPGRPGRSVARLGAGGGGRVPQRRHPGDHDHRRLSRHRAGHRARRPGLHGDRVITGDRAAGDVRRRAGSSGARTSPSSPASCRNRSCASSRR